MMNRVCRPGSLQQEAENKLLINICSRLERVKHKRFYYALAVLYSYYLQARKGTAWV